MNGDLSDKSKYIRDGVGPEGSYPHSIHCLCVDPIVPDEAPQNLSHGPLLIVTARRNGKRQIIRDGFEPIKASCPTGYNGSLIIGFDAYFGEIVFVYIFRVLIHFLRCARYSAVKCPADRIRALILIGKRRIERLEIPGGFHGYRFEITVFFNAQGRFFRSEQHIAVGIPDL